MKKVNSRNAGRKKLERPIQNKTISIFKDQDGKINNLSEFVRYKIDEELLKRK
jgi:hypothetical protein